MKVQDIMSTDVTWVAPEMPLKDAAKKMRDDDIGCLPVGKADKLIGMITDRDITCRAVAEGSIARSRVADAMSRGVTYCFDDQDVKEAAQLMETKRIHRLPVLNRQKRMVGIVSVGDLALHAPHELTGEVVEAVCQHTS
jgi:CBS domain-containing protein